DANVADVITDDDNNIYVAGTIDSQVMVTKHTPDGELDGSFGFFGATLADFPSLDESAAISVDSEGNIFVFGNGLLNGTLRGHITSFLSNGGINTSFTANGRKSFTWPDDGAFSVHDGFLSNNESRFYLVGSVYDGAQIDGAIIAVGYNANTIESFGTNGFLD